MSQKKKTGRERRILIGAVLLGGLALQLLTARHFWRLDLTEQKTYTLAPSTKNLLKEMKDIVTFRLYFSRDLPPLLQNLKRDTVDLLNEFKTYSKNKIRIEYKDPQENPIEEQKAQMLGIPPVEVTVIKKDKQELAKIYLGMTVEHLGKQEVLAVIDSINNLEYRVAAALVNVGRLEKPTIGWWGEASNFSEALEHLGSRFRVETISKENLERLDPEKIPVLIFAPGSGLEEKEKKAFENYLGQGGKALLLVESVSVALGEGLKAKLKDNPLEDFLKSYGITLPQQLLLDPSNVMATFTGGYFNFQLPYPYWVRIRPEGFDKKEPMVSELNSLIMTWASPLELSAALPEGVTATPLFTTTPQATASLLDPQMPLLPQEAQKKLESGSPKTFVVAALVNKQFVVVGNQAFLHNNFVQQFPENLLFLENAVDVFSMGEALVGIRSKGLRARPLALLSDNQKAVIKTLNMLASPLLLVGMGGWVYFWKKRRAAKLKLIFVAG